MDRKDFMQLLVLGSAAAVTGCLGGCSSDEAAPATAGATGIDFTLDLTAPENAGLVAGTGQVYGANNQVIVVKTSAGQYVAVQAPCTHEGTTVTFNASKQQFYCFKHNGYFSTSGTVQSGPPPSALMQYSVVQTGNSLRITG